VRTRFPAAAALSLLALAGCGKEGPPLVPEPRGPLASASVSVRQLGSFAEVEAVIPATRGTRPDQALARAELLRVDFPAGAKPPDDPGSFTRRGAEVASSNGPFEAGGRVPLADTTLPALEPLSGRLVRYAVRWRDTKGRPSPLTLAPDLVLAAPAAPPSAVSAAPVEGGVRVTWQPPPSGAPAGYNVYRGTAGGPLESTPRNAVPLPSPAFLDEDVTLGTTYRYVVRTVAAEGTPPRESTGSEPAPVVARDVFAPAPPRDLVAVREGGSVRLFWTPGEERDLAGYRVERRAGDGPFEPVAPLITQAQWLDESPPAGAIAYRVLALDRADPANASEPTPEVEVAAPIEPAP
jgi:hypothetical protein